jgi:fucose 4-O-acetylase-like acetyltransferase
MERNDTIDIMKGIGIISVVLGHCGLLPPKIIHFIYSFHMPLFFIIAGYFYKERGVVASLQKDAKRLLFPYVVFATIFVLNLKSATIIQYTIKGRFMSR